MHSTPKRPRKTPPTSFESHLYYNGDYPCSPSCVWTPNVNANNTLTGGTSRACTRWCAACTTSARTRSTPSGGATGFNLGEASISADVSYSKAKAQRAEPREQQPASAEQAARHADPELQRRQLLDHPAGPELLGPEHAVPDQHDLRLGLRQGAERGRRAQGLQAGRHAARARLGQQDVLRARGRA
jgi:hypothetical protein